MRWWTLVWVRRVRCWCVPTVTWLGSGMCHHAMRAVTHRAGVCWGRRGGSGRRVGGIRGCVDAMRRCLGAV